MIRNLGIQEDMLHFNHIYDRYLVDSYIGIIIGTVFEWIHIWLIMFLSLFLNSLIIMNCQLDIWSWWKTVIYKLLCYCWGCETVYLRKAIFKKITPNYIITLSKSCYLLVLLIAKRMLTSTPIIKKVVMLEFCLTLWFLKSTTGCN